VTVSATVIDKEVFLLIVVWLTRVICAVHPSTSCLLNLNPETVRNEERYHIGVPQARRQRKQSTMCVIV